MNVNKMDCNILNGNKTNLLIVEAHSDDSAISTAGFLNKFRDMYEYHFLLSACSDVYLHHYGFISRDVRLKEYDNYVNHFNGIWHKGDILPFDADATMDLIPRRQVVKAMEAGGMSDVDIARQMGMTRDEVRMILSLNQSNRVITEKIR